MTKNTIYMDLSEGNSRHVQRPNLLRNRRFSLSVEPNSFLPDVTFYTKNSKMNQLKTSQTVESSAHLQLRPSSTEITTTIDDNIMTNSMVENHCCNNHLALTRDLAVRLLTEYVRSLKDFTSIVKEGKQKNTKDSSTSPISSPNSKFHSEFSGRNNYSLEHEVNTYTDRLVVNAIACNELSNGLQKRFQCKMNAKPIAYCNDPASQRRINDINTIAKSGVPYMSSEESIVNISTSTLSDDIPRMYNEYSREFSGQKTATNSNKDFNTNMTLSSVFAVPRNGDRVSGRSEASTPIGNPIWAGQNAPEASKRLQESLSQHQQSQHQQGYHHTTAVQNATRATSSSLRSEVAFHRPYTHLLWPDDRIPSEAGPVSEGQVKHLTSSLSVQTSPNPSPIGLSRQDAGHNLFIPQTTRRSSFSTTSDYAPLRCLAFDQNPRFISSFGPRSHLPNASPSTKLYSNVRPGYQSRTVNHMPGGDTETKSNVSGEDRSGAGHSCSLAAQKTPLVDNRPPVNNGFQPNAMQFHQSISVTPMRQHAGQQQISVSFRSLEDDKGFGLGVQGGTSKRGEEETASTTWSARPIMSPPPPQQQQLQQKGGDEFSVQLHRLNRSSSFNRPVNAGRTGNFMPVTQQFISQRRPVDSKRLYNVLPTSPDLPGDGRQKLQTANSQAQPLTLGAWMRSDQNRATGVFDNCNFVTNGEERTPAVGTRNEELSARIRGSRPLSSVELQFSPSRQKTDISTQTDDLFNESDSSSEGDSREYSEPPDSSQASLQLKAPPFQGQVQVNQVASQSSGQLLPTSQPPPSTSPGVQMWLLSLQSIVRPEPSGVVDPAPKIVVSPNVTSFPGSEEDDSTGYRTTSGVRELKDQRITLPQPGRCEAFQRTAGHERRPLGSAFTGASPNRFSDQRRQQSPPPSGVDTSGHRHCLGSHSTRALSMGASLPRASPSPSDGTGQRCRSVHFSTDVLVAHTGSGPEPLMLTSAPLKEENSSPESTTSSADHPVTGVTAPPVWNKSRQLANSRGFFQPQQAAAEGQRCGMIVGSAFRMSRPSLPPTQRKSLLTRLHRVSELK